MNALSLILLIVFLVLVLMFLRYMLLNPYVVKGTVSNAQTASTISATSLPTSSSGAAATSFTYSVWFFVNDWDYKYGQPKVVFGRMGGKSASGSSGDVSGVSGVDPTPLVLLGATENTLTVSMACMAGIDTATDAAASDTSDATPRTVVHNAMLANIPLQKWVQLGIVVNTRVMDLYLDGKLVRTVYLPGVVAINSSAPIYVTPNGGFSGWVGKLSYYAEAMNPQQLWNIYREGYTTSWFNWFNTYQIQIALVENGTTQSSVTF